MSKSGLNYFPFDIDFFNDEKIEFLSARLGLRGEAIAIRLLCKIYRNGYYLQWGDDEALLFAKRVGDSCQHSFVNDVVHELVKRGFLDESIFNRFEILTSKGIQSRYFEASERRKKIDVIGEILLIDVKNMQNVNIIGLNVDILTENVDINPERKVKETKRKVITSLPPLRGDGPPEQKSDFIDDLVNCFANKYLEIRGIEYHIVHKEKERSCAAKILKIYKKKYPNADTTMVFESMGKYFEACLLLTTDNWLNKNMSLPIIINKFNEINNILKNGNQQRKNGSGASEAELAASISSFFAIDR
ncbi:MAG: DUF4373 domain-containing protein [Atribacterota bacterium]|nr:DUF4373 domain-containing protein [Atribacterota bacterium]